LSLMAAMAYSLSVVLVRKNLADSSVINAALVISSTGNFILWPLAILSVNLTKANLEAVLLFAIAGLLAPGISRLLYYKGMEFLGVSTNASVLSTYPLYALIFAVLFLGEVVFPLDLIGIACIIVGVMLLEKSLGVTETKKRGFLSRGLKLPLLAAFLVAVSHIVRKLGLSIYNEPPLGVAVGYAFSFFIYAVLGIFSNATERTSSLKRDFRLFWRPGVGLSLGWILTFYALSYEKVSIVTSLIQTEPLFVILFTSIYLRELERISFRLITSAVVVFLGIVLICV